MLDITQAPDGGHIVRHVPSGKALWPKWGRTTSLDACERARAVALSSGIDWSQSEADLRAALDAAALRTLYNRMRLAAHPPRRPRWHKGQQRRRLLPYEAASKRKAIRESREIGLNCLWQDLWVYRRRSEMWGILPAVIRQPCKRFGVTRDDVKLEALHASL